MAKKISQLKLPSPNDTDPHPRLLLDGYGCLWRYKDDSAACAYMAWAAHFIIGSVSCAVVPQFVQWDKIFLEEILS